jgi:hypothetical protein
MRCGANMMRDMLLRNERGLDRAPARARVSLAWFLAGSSWFLITMDHDREIISLVFAPTPPIEGSCE